MILPIEDTFPDVLRKALRSLNLSPNELAWPTGATEAEIQSLFDGVWSDGVGRSVARALGLRAESVAALAQDAWTPKPTPDLAGLHVFTVPYNGMTVNSYLIRDTNSKECSLFDTGPDSKDALDFIAEHDLKLASLFLTHTHTDHIMDVDKVMRQTGCKAYVHEKEAMPGLTPFAEPQRFSTGGLSIEARHTWGHSLGGTSYVITGLSLPVAIVGDALFAGSIGRPFISYQAALATIRTEIFSLDPATVLCPGHGPMSSVAEEMSFNPFFP